jgi:hypothetical protein
LAKQNIGGKGPSSNNNSNNISNNVEVDGSTGVANPTPVEARDLDRMSKMERMIDAMQTQLDRTQNELKVAKEEVVGLHRTLGQRDELVESMCTKIA